MDLSIIIPVYNVENFLPVCLESVKGPWPFSYEIILIDDGSTDSSGLLCDEFAKTEEYIIVIHQENKGLSAARNIGIQASRGNFLVFIDSDDYVKRIALEQCFFLIAEFVQVDWKIPDVIVNDFFRCLPDGTVCMQTNQIEGIHEKEYLLIYLSSKQCYWNAWRVICRRKFLVENKLLFKEGLLCEDVDFTTRVLLAAETICFIHAPYYCYRMGRADSIMGKVSYHRVFSVTYIIRELNGLLERRREDPASAKMRECLLKEYVLTMASIYEVPKEDRVKTLALYQDAKDSMAGQSILLKAAFFVGVRNTGFLLLGIKRVRRLFRKCKTKLSAIGLF